MAANYPLVIDQGETFRITMIYGIAPTDPTKPYEPIDLTGATARMQVREKYGSPVLVEITTENAGIVLGDAAGSIDLVLTDVQTDLMGVKEGSSQPRLKAVYDLEVIYPSGDVRRVCEGSVTINPNITREVPTP